MNDRRDAPQTPRTLPGRPAVPDVQAQQVRRALQDGAQAAVALARRLYGPLLKRCIRARVPEHRLDDVFQGTWELVFLHITSWRADRFHPWLFKLVRTALHDPRERPAGQSPPCRSGPLITARPARPPVSVGSIPYLPGITTAAHFRGVFERRLSPLLEKLDPVDRDILIRRAVDVEPYEDIATATGLQVEAVRQRFHRVRRRLMFALIDQGGEGGAVF